MVKLLAGYQDSPGVSTSTCCATIAPNLFGISSEQPDGKSEDIYAGFGETLLQPKKQNMDAMSILAVQSYVPA